jgi:hypothetical protein
MAGCAPFDLWLEGALASEELVSEGWVNGRWMPVEHPWSIAVIGEQLARDTLDPNLDRIAAHIRSTRSTVSGKIPGLGEVANHLMRHEGLGRTEAVATARRGGYQFTDSIWLNAEKYGRRRKLALGCRFCGGDALKSA